MKIERTITVDKTEYPVTLSDERETLLAAKAAGRVIVGLGTGDTSEWLPVDYVAGSLPLDETWLEGVARRELGLPWKITQSERLLIREFTLADCADIPDEADDSSDEAILKDPKRLQAYIREQYAFFDCGMWAVIRKEDERLIGMVSLTPASGPGVPAFSETAAASGETAGSVPVYVFEPSAGDVSSPRFCALGYHIYAPFRRMGYAREACGSILSLLGKRNMGAVVYTDPENSASVALLKSLGFRCFLR